MRPNLPAVPLRLKLIAAMLALVTVALLLIGMVSALALRTYLIDRVDGHLVNIADSVDVAKLQPQSTELYLPSDYMVAYYRGPAPSVSIDRGPSNYPVLPSVDNLSRLNNKSLTVRSRASSERWRLLVRRQADGTYLVVGESLSGSDDVVDRLVAAELIVGIGVLAVLASLGVGIVQASLRPLTEIERTAAAIASGDLASRVPESDPNTEVGHLAQSFNAMLAHIEVAFAARAASEERMRRFVADASHELRTPLTTIKGFAELYRQGAAQAPEQTAELLGRIESEASRMGLLVEDLLLLARLDQQRPLSFAPVELRAIASDAVTAARAVAPDRTIVLETGDESVLVIGDEPRLRQVVGNLMTNALTHTPGGTPVTVRVRREPTSAILEVSDAGPGLTDEQRARVFERFYRVDKARTRQAAGSAQAVAPHSGSGLGLAIVAALVAAHQGEVLVESTPGMGATFAVRLPQQPAVAMEDVDDVESADNVAGAETDLIPGQSPPGSLRPPEGPVQGA